MPRAEAAEGLGQRVVRLLQFGAEAVVVGRRQPQAEARAPVVVVRDLVVEAEALGAFAHQADGDALLVGPELLGQHGAADFFVVLLGELEAFHRSADLIGRPPRRPRPVAAACASFSRVRARFFAVRA